jgi:hypothetical protein
MSRVEVIGWRAYVIAGGDRNALDGLPLSPLLVRALSLQTQCSRRPKRPLRVAFRMGGYSSVISSGFPRIENTM